MGRLFDAIDELSATQTRFILGDGFCIIVNLRALAKSIFSLLIPLMMFFFSLFFLSLSFVVTHFALDSMSIDNESNLHETTNGLADFKIRFRIPTLSSHWVAIQKLLFIYIHTYLFIEIEVFSALHNVARMLISKTRNSR